MTEIDCIPLSVSLKTLSGRTLTGINIPLSVKVVYNLSLIGFKNDLYTNLIVAMVTKFNNLSLLYDFVAMETTVVPNNFTKNNILLVLPSVLASKIVFTEFLLLPWLHNSRI